MKAKQIREKREKQIALNAWYSCMIAMGGLPKNEDLYFETQERFKRKYKIRKNEKIKLTCNEDYKDIKDKYYDIHMKNMFC